VHDPRRDIGRHQSIDAPLNDMMALDRPASSDREHIIAVDARNGAENLNGQIAERDGMLYIIFRPRRRKVQSRLSKSISRQVKSATSFRRWPVRIKSWMKPQ